MNITPHPYQIPALKKKNVMKMIVSAATML